MKGYKVLTRYNKQLWSATCLSRETRYKVRQITKPPKGCGPLAVFTNLEDAKKFCSKSSKVIYGCEYTISKHKEFWDIDNGKKISHRGIYNGLPVGTVFASSVTLKREIK